MDDRKSNKFLSVKDLTVEYTLEGKTVHAVNKVSLELEPWHWWERLEQVKRLLQKQFFVFYRIHQQRLLREKFI